jgi:hypothetical protein
MRRPTRTQGWRDDDDDDDDDNDDNNIKISNSRNPLSL